MTECFKSVEIVDYGLGNPTSSPYQLFVEADKSGRLEYRYA
jgi:hypothetical protein